MTHVNTPSTTTRRVAGVAAALALSLFSACGNDSNAKSSSESDGYDVAAPAQTVNGVANGDNSISGGGEATNSARPVVDEQPSTAIPDVITDPSRKLIITMTVGVEVTSAADAVDKVIALADRHGG